MSKTEKYLIFGGVAFGVYWFVLRPSQPMPLALTAYDGSNQSINVDSNISADATNRIRTFFQAGGTMVNSTNPAQDEANLSAYLKGAGFPVAAASVDSLYRTLLVNAQLSAQPTQTASGYDAGAPFRARVQRNPRLIVPRGSMMPRG